MNGTPKDTAPRGSRQRRATRQNGPAIRALREMGGWSSQEALAAAVGIRQATLSDIENEFANGSLPTLRRIALKLHVPLDAIMRSQLLEGTAADASDGQEDAEEAPEPAGAAA